MKPVTLSMPGKVLLSGEHAVVYGKPALAAEINLKVSVECQVSSVKSKRNRDDRLGLIRKAVEIAGGDPQKLDIFIESDLPIGSGLGSSAAVSAAVIKAVRLFSGKPVDTDELFRLTMECEKIAHGNPSGVDPAAVIYGGLIWYTKGQPIEHFAMKTPRTFYLVNSGRPTESTGDMVEQVATSYKLQETKVGRIFNSIGLVTNKMKAALEEGENIGELINENGRLLEELGVVGQQATDISERLRREGLSVKVVGAGGVQAGSGMLMVYHSDCSVAERILQQKKLDYFKVTIGG